MGSSLTSHRRPSVVRRALFALGCLTLFATACTIEPVTTAEGAFVSPTEVAAPADGVDATTDDADAPDANTDTGESDSESDNQSDSEADSEADEAGDQPSALDSLGDDFVVDDPAALAMIADGNCDSFFEIAGPPDGTDPDCYTVTVPANWATPDDGDTVQLPVVVFRALEPGTDDAVVYLEGGPGGNSVESAPFSYGSLVAPFQATRDVVIFDQRGAGLSAPVLDCPEADAATIEAYEGGLEKAEEEGLFIDALFECRDRLTDSDIELDEYHSVYSAIDTEAIRRSLGFEPWNVLGISYGTRLGQTLMRMYPDGVRSIVLDSVVPVSADMSPDFAPNAARAFEKMFDGCEADEACAAAYPTFREDYFRLVDQWDAEPAEFEATNSLTSDTYAFVADGDDLLDVTFSALYSPTTFAVIPRLVSQGLDGDTSLFGDLVSLEITNADFLSIGMLISVRCNEEEPFEDSAEIEALKPADEYFARFAVNELEPVCDEWPAGEASDVEDQLVVSDVPTLLMAGDYDPITPPSGLPVIAEGLSTSWSVVFPHDAHGVAPSKCGADIVNQFFDDPVTEPDTSCIADTEPPAFTPRLGGSITMVPFESSLLGSTISGTRPEAWDSQGFGVFARSMTIDDPALLLVQPSGGLPASFVLTFLEDALGWSGQPEKTGELETDAGTWSIYEGTFGEESVAVGFLAGDADVFVGFGAYTEEYDALYESVFVPALEAIAS